MSTPDPCLVPLTPAWSDAVHAMTFPAYRHLLSLSPGPRHPQDDDTRRIQPCGVVAFDPNASVHHPIGLALAELPIEDDRPPEVLSLFVAPTHRGRGIGTRLLEGLEQQIADWHQPRVDMVYMTGRPGIPIVERMLARRGWQPPAVRTCTMRFTVDEAARMPWFGRVPLADADFELFSWIDLDPSERAALVDSQRDRAWITPGLEFWRHEAHCDPVSSLGLRYRGEVVGWTINHRLAADTVRISGAFVRDDLMRRGRLMALWTASIARMRDAGIHWICSITPVQLAPMIAFLRRRCAPWATFIGETRGSHKMLAPTGHLVSAMAGR